MDSSLPSRSSIPTLDYRSQPDASDLILPSSARISSESRWNNIHFEVQRQPAYDTGEHIHNMHILTMVTSDTTIDQKIDGNSRCGLAGKNNAFLLPAGAVHHCQWRQDIEFIFVGLAPEAFSQAGQGLIPPNRIELVPHFATLEDPLIQGILLTLKEELLTDGLSSHLLIDQLRNTLTTYLLLKFGVHKAQVYSYADGLSRRKLDHVLEYIEAYLDKKLVVKELADQASMSQFYFSRLFRTSMNKTPHQYVIERRVERAKQFLKNKEQSILSIAIACGFSNQGHLTNHFKRLTGITPFAFRKNL